MPNRRGRDSGGVCSYSARPCRGREAHAPAVAVRAKRAGEGGEEPRNSHTEPGGGARGTKGPTGARHTTTKPEDTSEARKARPAAPPRRRERAKRHDRAQRGSKRGNEG